MTNNINTATDKEKILYMNSFEVKLRKEIEQLLRQPEYQHLKVAQCEVFEGKTDNILGGAFRVDSNASLNIKASDNFICDVNTLLKQDEDEIKIFFGPDKQLRLKLNLEVRETTTKPVAEGQVYKPVEPRFSFDQLILPAKVKGEIMEALNLLKYQSLIYKEWGFAKMDPVAKSVLNFYGPPGTGKTMCAHTVARHLGKRLLALNYAEIESKYVGDAAKNLTNAFNTAREQDCVLFFDEADSFLGKRIENVTQGSDQALNSLRSQMLILLEEFEGVVIFATNLVKNFDHAFESRILKHIKFDLPNEDARMAIIKDMIPERLPLTAPLAEEQFRELSKIMEGLSGREIKGAVLECMLSKVTEQGEAALFSFSDFEAAFKHKQESLKKLDEEKKRAKADKILQAFKDGKEPEAAKAEGEPEAENTKTEAPQEA